MKGRALMSIELLGHRERFLTFIKPYTAGAEDGPVRLKVEHSFRVLEHVQLLVETEGLDAPADGDTTVGRAAMLAGLYHDCGRFPQFRQYHTFQDAQSVDHAKLGAEIIREQGFLEHESGRIQELVSGSVELHNRYALPDELDADLRLVTDMVRDADKLDILRVMVEHLDGALPEKDTVLLRVRDEPERWTPKILDDVQAGRVARYDDLQYVNDFRLLLGTWLHALRFPVTRAALARSGLMDAVLDGLPDVPEMARAVVYLRGLLPASIMPDPKSPGKGDASGKANAPAGN